TASELTVTAKISNVSPAIFFDAASSKHLDHAVLNVYSPNGLDQTTWTLTNVYITSYVDQDGVDTFTVSFTAMSEKHTRLVKGPVPTDVSWDFATNQGRTTGAAAPEFNPKAPPEIAMTVGNAANSILNGFVLGSVSSKTGTGGPRTVSYGPSTIHKTTATSSVDLLNALLTGREIRVANVAFRDPSTRRITNFGLANVRVVSLQISGVSGEAPNESYTLADVR